MRLGHDGSVEILRRLSRDIQQQRLRLARCTEEGAVSSTILKSVRHKHLTDDVPLRILHGTHSDPELLFADIKDRGCGAAEQEA
jgi:hypothetical protein